MLRRITLTSVVAAAAMALGWTVPVAAEEDYPTSSVRVIVPFAAGGGNDHVGRVVAEFLSQEIGESFVVENIPGANAALGMQTLSRADTDGYTIGVSSESSLVINPHLRDVPYEPLESFRPISGLATGYLVLVAHEDLGVESLEEFIELAEENPGTIRFGTAGIGNMTHMAVEQFMAETGVDLVHVPYEGMGPATTGLLSGDVQFGAYTIQSMVGQIRAGEVVGLGINERIEAIPDVPSFEEAGMPDYNANSWISLFAPADTPDHIVNRISEALDVVLEDPDLDSQMREGGWVPHNLTADEVTDLIISDSERWGQIIEEAGITVDD